jgi:hypothetical protein
MNPLVLKWVAIGLVAASLFGAGFKTGSDLMERRWLLEKVDVERQRAADALAAQGVSNAYQLRLVDLENAARNRPTRIVRLCNDPVQVPGAGSGSDGSAAGGLPPTAGPDIGRGLEDLAKDADKCAAQLKALQDWVKTVASSKG